MIEKYLTLHQLPNICTDIRLVVYLYTYGFIDFKHTPELERQLAVVIIPSHTVTLNKKSYVIFYKYVESNTIKIKCDVEENGLKVFTRDIEVFPYNKSKSASNKLEQMYNNYLSEGYSNIVTLPENVTLLKLLN